MTNFLPKLLTTITGRDRYIPKIEWSDKCWTHNAFRAFELVFGRAFGKGGVGDTIRRESSVKVELIDGVMHVQREFYTLEAAIAHIEGAIRTSIASAFEPRPEYYFMPQPVFLTLAVLGLKLSFQGDMNGLLSPLIGMAIARDASGSLRTASTSSINVSVTTSGSNRLMMLYGQLQDNTRSWSSITYAGNATTQIGSNIVYAANSAPGQLRYQIAPTSGTNNATFTASGSTTVQGYVISYTGALQSGVPDATAQQANGTTSQSITVVASNCWMVQAAVGFNNDFDTPGPGYAQPTSGTTTIVQFNDDGGAICDSNGTVSTGSQTFNWSGLISNNGRIAASFAPSVETATGGFFRAAM